MEKEAFLYPVVGCYELIQKIKKRLVKYTLTKILLKAYTPLITYVIKIPTSIHTKFSIKVF